MMMLQAVKVNHDAEIELLLICNDENQRSRRGLHKCALCLNAVHDECWRRCGGYHCSNQEAKCIHCRATQPPFPEEQSHVT